MFLLVVVVVAALGGFVPAFVCAITGFLLANWYFTPPYYEFTISEGENLFALVIFLLVAGVVGLLVATASRAHGRGGAGARRSGDARGVERHAVGVRAIRCRSWSTSCASRSRPTASPSSAMAGWRRLAGAGERG